MKHATFEVLYASPEDSFHTIQICTPRDQKYYRVIEVSPVFLQAAYPNQLDVSDPRARWS